MPKTEYQRKRRAAAKAAKMNKVSETIKYETKIKGYDQIGLSPMEINREGIEAIFRLPPGGEFTSATNWRYRVIKNIDDEKSMFRTKGRLIINIDEDGVPSRKNNSIGYIYLSKKGAFKDASAAIGITSISIFNGGRKIKRPAELEKEYENIIERK